MKKVLLVFAVIILSIQFVYVGEWIQNGELWSYKEDDGILAVSKWITFDSDNDGKKEYYYFDDAGIMLVNVITPDGYQLNEKGQWVQDGIIKQESENSGYLTAGKKEVKMTSEQTKAHAIAMIYSKKYPQYSQKRFYKLIKSTMRNVYGYKNFSIDDAIIVVDSCNIEWQEQAVKAGRLYIKKYPDIDIEEVESYLKNWCEYPKQIAKTASKRALKEYLQNDYYVMSDDDFIADFVSSGFTEEEAKKALQEIKKQENEESDANNGVHP